MTRRSFLISFLSLLLPYKNAFSQSRKKITDEAILRRLLDVIIPSDNTPGAQEAHLYERLIDLISEDKGKKKLYDEGLSMVRAKIETIPLEKVDWDAVAKKIAPSRFFRKLRLDAMRLFYSNPVGWKTVGYQGPPLIGYRNYHKCEK